MSDPRKLLWVCLAGCWSLSASGGHLFRVDLGQVHANIRVNDGQLLVEDKVSMPLLGGELSLNNLVLEGLSAPPLNWQLAMTAKKIQLDALSKALDWPPLSGKLSGMIPRASYKKHELTLGGILLVQAFDGDITVHNLRVLDPLGTVPRLWADIRLKHLDLKTLTRTFSFGRIDGRLEGRVDDLYMEVWQPVSFDAAFRTPPGDSSRRRISQRAVDNISNLGGGGIAGAVSRSFLSFLEDFPYKALGIRCRLENGICRMGGVGPASSGSGYYLVQGRWLPPRLDVIGFAEDVDWYSLIERLKLITEGEQAVIK